MSTASTWLAHSRDLASRNARPATAPTPGLFARLERSIALYRQRRAERLVAGFIESHGGRLTDSVERQIGDRALRS